MPLSPAGRRHGGRGRRTKRPRPTLRAPHVLTIIGGQKTHSWRLIRALVLDDVEPLLTELREVVQHAFQYFGVVALPALQLGGDAQRVLGPVRLRGVAGKSLVGDVRVVLKRAHGFDDVDVPSLPTSGERGGQFGSPSACLHERGEVDVVGHPAFMEVGAVARNELGAGPSADFVPW